MKNIISKKFLKPITNENELKITETTEECFEKVEFTKESIKKLSERLFKSFTKPMTKEEYNSRFN